MNVEWVDLTPDMLADFPCECGDVVHSQVLIVQAVDDYRKVGAALQRICLKCGHYECIKLRVKFL